MSNILFDLQKDLNPKMQLFYQLHKKQPGLQGFKKQTLTKFA